MKQRGRVNAISVRSHDDWRNRIACRVGAGRRSPRSQGVNLGCLVGQPFDLPFELPHCLSGSPHNAKSRVPRDPSRRPRIAVHPVFHNWQHPSNVQSDEKGTLRFGFNQNENIERQRHAAQLRVPRPRSATATQRRLRVVQLKTRPMVDGSRDVESFGQRWAFLAVFRRGIGDRLDSGSSRFDCAALSSFRGLPQSGTLPMRNC